MLVTTEQCAKSIRHSISEQSGFKSLNSSSSLTVDCRPNDTAVAAVANASTRRQCVFLYQVGAVSAAHLSSRLIHIADVAPPETSLVKFLESSKLDRLEGPSTLCCVVFARTAASAHGCGGWKPSCVGVHRRVSDARHIDLDSK